MPVASLQRSSCRARGLLVLLGVRRPVNMGFVETFLNVVLPPAGKLFLFLLFFILFRKYYNYGDAYGIVSAQDFGSWRTIEYEYAE